MKKKICITLALVIMVLGNLHAQKIDPVIEKIIEIGQNDNRTMRHLDVISNRFGGRMVGSDAYENSLEWIASEFKKWGMDVVIEEAGEVPVGFNRGPWFGKVVGVDGMALNFVTPSFSSGTKGVQVGHVLIEPKTKAAFNSMKKALNGAWVLVSGTNQGWAIDSGDVANERRAKMIAENEEIAKQNIEIRKENRKNGTKVELIPLKNEPGLFHKEMVEAGALGFIQSSRVPLRGLYDRSVLKNTEMTFDELPTTPDIKLDEHQYNEIYQWVKERRNIQLEFEIRNHFKMGPIKYHTITGVIKGTKYPDEYVMLTGHLDAYDVGTGGVDCGSGITPAMEAGRLIMAAGGKPKRTILVTLFAAEEIGLLGAISWADKNKDKLPKISNLFNRDGGPTVPTGISVPDGMYKDFVKVCAPINSINPDFPFEVKKRTEPIVKPSQPGGHDGTVFMCLGVPAIGFSTGDPKGYNFSYGEIWHTDRDTYNKSIPEYQKQAAVVNAVVAYGIANLDHQLNREGLYIDKK